TSKVRSAPQRENVSSSRESPSQVSIPQRFDQHLNKKGTYFVDIVVVRFNTSKVRSAPQHEVVSPVSESDMDFQYLKYSINTSTFSGRACATVEYIVFQYLKGSISTSTNFLLLL